MAQTISPFLRSGLLSFPGSTQCELQQTPRGAAVCAVVLAAELSLLLALQLRGSAPQHVCVRCDSFLFVLSNLSFGTGFNSAALSAV